MNVIGNSNINDSHSTSSYYTSVNITFIRYSESKKRGSDTAIVSLETKQKIFDNQKIAIQNDKKL